MAKKPRTKKSKAAPASNGGIDESALTKGELRKLNALRKSVGETLGEQTFAKWLEKKAKGTASEPDDRNALLIADALVGLINEKGLRIPRGGYVVTRGRGRVIVTQAKQG
jgi:hypothetical protein